MNTPEMQMTLQVKIRKVAGRFYIHVTDTTSNPHKRKSVKYQIPENHSDNDQDFAASSIIGQLIKQRLKEKRLTK